MADPKKTYQRRESRYEQVLRQQQKTERLLSNLRLLVFAVGIGIGLLLYILQYYSLFAFAAFASAIIFIYLVLRHGKLVDGIRKTTILRDINTAALKRLNGEWNTFSDDGADFKDDRHHYSADLDIFGDTSLFQWTNTAKTFVGRQKLRDLFSGLTGNSKEILDRQNAVEELATLLDWRQSFLAEGMMASGKMRNPRDIITWAKEGSEFFRKPGVIAAIRVCPVITVILAVAGFAMNLIPWTVPIIALVLQFGLLSYKGKERNRMFGIAEFYADDLRVYYKMLKLFEDQIFKSPYIKGIEEGIRSKEGLDAFKQVDRLSRIIDSIANRRNIVYGIFNLIALWDFQNIIALEKWKQQSGDSLKDWFDALGWIEALASLAVVRYDNPDWALPIIDDGPESIFAAGDIGHPLLPGKRGYNDLAIDSNVKVLLITGSNMSGKSTLLRTAGINLVLAYAGAPVCAKSFRASIMGIYSCMRVSDNLGESISSFYAELVRIKEIVGNAQAGKRVFFLLDEVFKGTNSLDRHTGAKVLINKLSFTNSIGLVSTHDLELCDLQGENDKIANYHFQEYYQDGKIFFDYQLRPGPSTTRNALYLMRLAGIEIDE